MAQVVITKSSTVVDSTGSIATATSGTGGLGLSIAANQYAIVTCTIVAGGTASLNIDSAIFALTPGAVHQFYAGPSSVVTRTQSAHNFYASWVIFENS